MHRNKYFFFVFQGFILDSPFDKTAIEGNNAYFLKTSFFREGRTYTGKYKKDGATFIGKLSK